ncbi:hypothetical protein ACXGQW_09865 [Wenyingzhuangia sp. IMCC45533]
MKNLTYTYYLNIINKIKNNPYLYVSTYKEAKQKLIPDQFIQLQNSLVA